MTVAKLRGTRDRKRKAYGKCEGRKSLAELHPADVVREAKRLGRASPLNGKRQYLRKIAAELAKIGETLDGERYAWSKRDGPSLLRTQRPALQRQDRAGNAGAAGAGLSPGRWVTETHSQAKGYISRCYW